MYFSAGYVFARCQLFCHGHGFPRDLFVFPSNWEAVSMSFHAVILLTGGRKHARRPMHAVVRTTVPSLSDVA
jgi:hypothetical protein